MLDLSPLGQHDAGANPYGADFDDLAEFKTLDVAAVKKDIDKVLATPQPWWPPDYSGAVEFRHRPKSLTQMAPSIAATSRDASTRIARVATVGWKSESRRSNFGHVDEASAAQTARTGRR